MTRTLIIGAGITGAALAFQLSRRGDDVTLVSTHAEGGLASAASFGWLNASFFLGQAHFHLRHQGLAAHRRLQDLLAGLPTTWQGCLWYEATGEAQEETATDLAAFGYRVTRLTRPQIADRLPALGPVPDSALFFPEEGASDPAILARALIQASGAEVIRATVQSLSEKNGRVTGVLTDLGAIKADRVILATGTGTPALLEPLGTTLPMLQRPGLMLATNALPPICPVILATPDQEVRQDAQGNQFGIVHGKPGFFRQKRDLVDEFIEGTGQRIDYDSKADTVRFTGNAVLKRFKGTQLNDETTGNVIVYNNTTDVFTVDGGEANRTPQNPTGRVRAMLTPVPKEGGVPATPAPPAPPATLKPSPQLQEGRQ